MGSLIWMILIGALIGMVAKFLMPGDNEPKGFVLTAILGIVGAIVASYIGQALHFYADGESAGFIASVLGAIVVLFVYAAVMKRRV